ncbi:MAG: PIN domain-containing protein [Treponema sp.]|nr:PIN domain-containing protein [Treponema sp.]
MRDKAFLDTNILVYLFSEDEHEKSKACSTVLTEYLCITSTQAINELCNVFTKKWNLPIIGIKEAVREIEGVCNIQRIDMAVISRALDIHNMYGYSYYDCLMLSCAISNGCKYILSEDMQDGQKIDSLEIVNIFR